MCTTGLQLFIGWCPDVVCHRGDHPTCCRCHSRCTAYAPTVCAGRCSHHVALPYCGWHGLYQPAQHAGLGTGRVLLLNDFPDVNVHDSRCPVMLFGRRWVCTCWSKASLADTDRHVKPAAAGGRSVSNPQCLGSLLRHCCKAACTKQSFDTLVLHGQQQ